MLNERLQILISPEQRRRLEDEARRRGASVASLIRQAIDARFAPVTPEQRLRAVESIRKLHGKDVSPDALDQLVEEEREESLRRMRLP